MKIVVYQDRNLSDKKINNGLNTIFVSLKNKYKDMMYYLLNIIS